MLSWVMLAAAVIGEPSVYEKEAAVYRKLYQAELEEAREMLEHVEDARISRRREPGLDGGVYWLPNRFVKRRLEYQYTVMIKKLEKALSGKGPLLPWYRTEGPEPGQVRFIPKAKFRAMVKGRPVYHSQDGYLWLNDESMQSVQKIHRDTDEWPKEFKVGWYRVIREDSETIDGHKGLLRTVDTTSQVGIQLGVYLKQK